MSLLFFPAADVVRPEAMQAQRQRPRRMPPGSELHAPQRSPLLCETLPGAGRVLGLRPCSASNQMPPQLLLPGQQLRQHHLHPKKGDHAHGKFPRHLEMKRLNYRLFDSSPVGGGRKWIRSARWEGSGLEKAISRENKQFKNSFMPFKHVEFIKHVNIPALYNWVVLISILLLK